MGRREKTSDKKKQNIQRIDNVFCSITTTIESPLKGGEKKSSTSQILHLETIWPVCKVKSWLKS